jgi:endonuclease III
VRRVLRLDDDQRHEQHLQRYHALNPAAAARGQGLLFRSPTPWEDVVKTVLLCNCGWARTVGMARALCQQLGGAAGAFPGPAHVAALPPAQLQQRCGLGYRAGHIHKLASRLVAGDLDLSSLRLQEGAQGAGALQQRLLQLPGIGPFGASNLLQLLGHQEAIPCDTETVRHLQACHGRRGCSLGNVRAMAQQVGGRALLCRTGAACPGAPAWRPAAWGRPPRAGADRLPRRRSSTPSTRPTSSWPTGTSCGPPTKRAPAHS